MYIVKYNTVFSPLTFFKIRMMITLEYCMAVPQNVKHKTQQFHPAGGHISREMKTYIYTKHLHMNVHSSNIYNSYKVQITQTGKNKITISKTVCGCLSVLRNSITFFILEKGVSFLLSHKYF